jgi:ADP-heptose:LPS heptosyltransferase
MGNKMHCKKMKIISFNVLHIGDFVLTTSAIAILKKTFPDFEITVVAPKTVKTLCENNPIIDKMVYCPYPEYNFNSQLKRIFWFILNYPKLFFNHYDLCLILDSSRLSIMFAKALFIKNIAGIDKNLNGVNVKEDLKKYYDGSLHPINRSQTIVKSHFGIYNNALPVLPDYLKYEQEIQKLIKYKNNINIALCLKGAEEKRDKSSQDAIDSKWNRDNFAQMIKLIKSKFYNTDFYIVGAKNDVDYAQKLAKQERIENLCFKTTLVQLMAFLNNIDLLISVDTGTTHLAANTKTNIIVLKPNSDFIAPVSHRLKIIEADKINLITPQMVFNVVDKFLTSYLK